MGLLIEKQVMGVEPTSSAWEANVLPMHHTCIISVLRLPPLWKPQYDLISGAGGIRTLVPVARQTDFESAPL